MRYVVTNSHVAVNCGAIRLNTKDGSSDVIPLSKEAWIHHPAGDDLAIAAMSLSDRFQYKALPMNTFSLTKEDIALYNVGPGDDIFFMGRFITHEGKQRNQPVVRFGTIAMMPGEPIFQPERGHHQESFLVEARSLSGFSGSPVMLYIPPFSHRFRGGKFEPGDGLDTSTTTGLLGVDWGNMHLGDEALTNSGIMAVVPVWKLTELLDDEEVAAIRDAAAAAAIRDSSASLNVAAEPKDYERFEELLDKVIRVPKQEIEEGLQES